MHRKRFLRLLLSTMLITLFACHPQAQTPETAGAADPSVTSKEVTYSSGTTTMKGFIAYPATNEKRPGVLVVHEWWGLNDYVRARARKLAELGYVAFAVDMYGDGKVTDHPEQAKEFMMATLSNMDDAQKRFEAAQALLASDARVDGSKLAAIGYCFGGATVLHMARAGDDLKLVASFHGSLGTQKPMQKGVFNGKIFVAHGAADLLVPAEQVAAFKQEMEAASTPYELVEYAGAKHGFTNPEASALGQKNSMPLEYNAEADAASWQHLVELLAQL